MQTQKIPTKEWRHRLLAYNKAILDKMTATQPLPGLEPKTNLMDFFKENTDIFSLDTAAFPKANVIVEGGRDSRVFEQKKLEHMPISFSHRQQNGLKESVEAEQALKYILNDTMGIFGQIMNGGYGTSGSYTGDTTQVKASKTSYTLSKRNTEIAIERNHFYEKADLRTMRNLAGHWLYGAKKIEQSEGEWTLLSLDKISNTRHSSSSRFAFFLKNKTTIYGFRIISPLPEDIYTILDSLEIEQQGFNFAFKEGVLVDFSLR